MPHTPSKPVEDLDLLQRILLAIGGLKGSIYQYDKQELEWVGTKLNAIKYYNKGNLVATIELTWIGNDLVSMERK